MGVITSARSLKLDTDWSDVRHYLMILIYARYFYIINRLIKKFSFENKIMNTNI